MNRRFVFHLAILCSAAMIQSPFGANAADFSAGAAKVDISDPDTPSHDPLFVKALVLKDDATTVALITVDAVAIGELGRIKNDYLANVRAALQNELHIPPSNVLINASHCHGVVCLDIEQRTIQAVKDAARKLEPVLVGAGTSREDRIMENRRLRLKDGREADVRHAYALPPDEEVAAIGPVDPEVGLLRLDRPNGKTLAVVYNFACHPILGVPSGENTADISGFASKVIEDNSDSAVALFLQGCAGDINPVTYKDVHNPRDAETLGNLLGLAALRGLKQIQPKPTGTIRVQQETIALPRAADYEQRIAAIQAAQAQLLKSLTGTSLNLKTFVPLYLQYQLSGDYPSYYSHRYMHDQMLGKNDLGKLDANNRQNIEHYIRNVLAMEELARLQTNLDLLKMHQAQTLAAGKPTLDVEVTVLTVGDFVLTTFPGELSVEIGLNIKKAAPRDLTFVAAYTNGYIYYAPTEQQRRNTGYAQEDCDCLLAPEWQKIYETRVSEMLRKP